MFKKFIERALILFFGMLTIFSCYSLAPAQTCQPAGDGLVSWYRAEGGAADEQGINHGALQNGTTFAPGRAGRAFKFDGVDDFVEIPDAPSLKPPHLTLEAWVKFDSLTSPGIGNAPPGFQYIAFKKNANQLLFEGYSLIKLPDNRLAYSSTNSGVQTTVIDNTQTVEVGKYYHVVGTYDGTTARLYVNGRKVGEVFHGLPLDSGTRPLIIGGTNETNWDGRMNGLIDEVKIYNRALSDLEVLTNYLNDNCRAAADVPAGLVSWYGGDGDARDFTGANSPNQFPTQNFIVGKVGQAFRFAGQSSYVKINSPGIFRGQTEGTIETWVRPRAFPSGKFGNSAIWTETEASTTSTRFGIYYSAEGKLGAYSNFSQFNAISPFAVPQNEWTHVAAIYKAGETVKLYVNGVLAATSPSGGAFSTEPSRFVGIGALPSGFNDDFLLDGDVDEASVYTRALSAAEIQSIYNAGTAGKARRAAISTGDNGAVTIRDATLTFANVSVAGETSQTPLDVAALPPLPSGFAHTGLAYDISTTAALTGNIDVCFNLPALAGVNFPRRRILHLENGNWVDRTTAVNSPQLCGRVSSLSPFVIAENLAPTAASVTVAGRVLTGIGQGVYRARVTITDSRGAVRWATTNPFGYYRFTEVPAGETYVLRASAKGYVFEPESMVLFVADDLLDADFTAQENFKEARRKTAVSRKRSFPVKAAGTSLY